MKSLKLDHDLAQLVLAGEKTSTWRLFDDKQLSVNDTVRLIDKVDSTKPETWQMIGSGRINQVIQKRLGDITAEDMRGHASYTSPDKIVTDLQKYYKNDVTIATIVKIINFDFTPLEQIKDDEKTTLYLEKVKIYADGGSRGNPGPSASGYVIIDPQTDRVIVDKGIYLGVTTNNQAEYLALKLALEECKKMNAREVDCYMDSLLVINQMKGIFKIKNRDLWPIHETIKQLVAYFDTVTFSHVPRELNKLADAAVNRTLDDHANSVVV